MESRKESNNDIMHALKNDTKNTSNDDDEEEFQSSLRVATSSSSKPSSQHATAVGTIESRNGVASLHSTTLSNRGSIRLETVRPKEETHEHQQHAPYGFCHGDFHSGKVFDLHVRCFVMALHARLLAVGLYGQEGVALYETQTFSIVHILPRNDTVSSLQWLDLEKNESMLLAVGGLDGVVTVYSIQSDLVELQGATVLHEFQVENQVRAMTISHLSTGDLPSVQLTVGCKSGTVTMSTFSLGQSVLLHQNETRFSDGILGLDYSGSLLAISTKAGEVSVRRVVRGSLGPEVFGVQRRGPVRSIVFSKDGTRLVFGGYDKTVVVVDTTLWAITRELQVEGTINTLSFDKLDERYLAVGTRAKSFILFDTSTWCALKTIHTPGWVTSVSWGDADQGKANFVAVRTELNCLSFLDLTPVHKTSIQLSCNSETERSLSWSRDGRFLVRTTGNRIAVCDARDGFAHVADFDTGGNVQCVAFCVAKEMTDMIAVVNTTGYLFVLQLVLNESKYSIKVKHSVFIEENLWVVAWSSDGKLLATGGRGKVLHIISTSHFEKKCDPIAMAGRVWAIDFVPEKLVARKSDEANHSFLTVGTGDYIATVYDSSFQPTLQVMRARTVRCLKYHPSCSILAIGDGSNLVVIIDFFKQEPVVEFSVDGRVNCLAFSPNGDFLCVGSDDCRFTIHETASYKPLQEISSCGFAVSAAFSPNGEYLILGNADGDFTIIRLGPLLATELVPLKPASDVTSLPPWVLNETLYRSGDCPSLVQRYMMDGSPESLKLVAHLLQHHPDAIYAFDRTNGKGCFDTAISLQKPNLLKLTLTTLVDGSFEADSNNSAKRSILATELPECGAEALFDMIFNHPPQFIVDILRSMVFLKVPFTHPHELSRHAPRECGSSSYTDPWQRMSRRDFTLRNKKIEGSRYRTPACLPLPRLGTLRFLSALIENTPPEVFDNDAMGLVLRVMWRRHVRIYFVVDLIIYLVFFILWIFYVDWTASTTASSISEVMELAVAVVLLVLNTLFAAKEFVQSGLGRRWAYLKSGWNIVDLVSIALVYAYILSNAGRSGAAAGLVPLVVVATIFVTLKLLAYLRGFSDTGWLISVLRENFKDVRGFVIVLAVCLVGFALSFRVLFGNTQGECGVAEGCTAYPFGTYGRALLSTFELTVIGVYDPAILQESPYRILAVFIFVLAVMCVLVIALNALIALLSDSYARVQENSTANRRKERAELVVEYLAIMPRSQRRRIEIQTQYFHALLEADEDGDLLVNEDDWLGGLNALRRDLQEDQTKQNEATVQALDQMRLEFNQNLDALQTKMCSMLDDLSEEVQELKRNQGGVTFNGQNVQKAVKVVRNIGQNGPFWGKNKAQGRMKTDI